MRLSAVRARSSLKAHVAGPTMMPPRRRRRRRLLLAASLARARLLCCPAAQLPRLKGHRLRAKRAAVLVGRCKGRQRERRERRMGARQMRPGEMVSVSCRDDRTSGARGSSADGSLIHTAADRIAIGGGAPPHPPRHRRLGSERGRRRSTGGGCGGVSSELWENWSRSVRVDRSCAAGEGTRENPEAARQIVDTRLGHSQTEGRSSARAAHEMM